MGYVKDDPDLQSVVSAPETPLAVQAGWDADQKAIAGVYNRLGGLMAALAGRFKVTLPGPLAVWAVESGGRVHVPNQAVIRFENHHFFKWWGSRNGEAFDRFFQYGGRNGVPGKSWENHKFRSDETAGFASFHGNQQKEYTVLAFAERLGGQEAAYLSISIGGAQILVSNYQMIGYASASAMVDAFQADERNHVFGFFDYAEAVGDMIGALQRQDWTAVAALYNGPSNAKTYGEKIARAYDKACGLLPAAAVA